MQDSTKHKIKIFNIAYLLQGGEYHYLDVMAKGLRAGTLLEHDLSDAAYAAKAFELFFEGLSKEISLTGKNIILWSDGGLRSVDNLLNLSQLSLQHQFTFEVISMLTSR